MTKYYKGWITLPIDQHVAARTEKAVCFTVAGGYSTANDSDLWVPRSIIKLGEPNENGNADIFIPMWFVAKHGLWKNIERLREVNFTKMDIVEF
jgi:hypothetical protein